MAYNSLYKENGDFRTVIAWIAYFFINIVFCVKYNPFGEIKPLYIIVAYPVVVFGVHKLTSYLRVQQKNVFFLILAFLIMALSCFLLYYIDKWSLNVDRWSAIAFWSENLHHGRFPYGAQTHLGGYASPFPVWQILHYPFYLMGDTAYAEIFCLFIFFVCLFVWRTKINIGGFALLMLLSPAFWWEFAVRSDLLCNMLLVFIFIAAHFYHERFWEKRKYLTALIIGLFLCTKLLTAIPLFLFFFPRFLKYRGEEKVLAALTVFVGFALPFVPLLFGDKGLLAHPEYNPMFQQTRQGNIWIVAGLAVLMLACSLYWRKLRQLFFLAGLLLFGLIFAVGVNILLNNGLDWKSLIFDDEFDKSYFNVSLPFFLFCINEAKEKIFRFSRSF